jgi:hypothetical protein
MANLIVGNDGANALPGTTGRDVIYVFNPEGPSHRSPRPALPRD